MAVTSTITREIAELYRNDKGYTVEVNMILWNESEPKYDIRH